MIVRRADLVAAAVRITLYSWAHKIQRKTRIVL